MSKAWNPLAAEPDCWFLTGPTASGKTAVGVELARRLGAEVASLDSMALYHGLDIVTAKPTLAERQAVPHHLVDVVEPHEDFSVAQYVAAAHAVVARLRARGKPTLFVGGTPLYLKALLRGLFEGPPADWPWREQLAAEAARQPAGWLHARLAEVDSAAAARLHTRDARRLIRALEVFHQTGRPISAWQQQFKRATLPARCRVFVLDWPTADLERRIDARVEQMFRAGLVAEVARFLDADPPLSRTAQQAVGYAEVAVHLRGEIDQAAAIARVQTRTRQFAKRQRTWFRSLGECRAVPVGEPFEPAAVAREIARLGSGDAD